MSTTSRATPFSPATERAERALAKLIRTIAQLRNPEGGCPWDLEQTHESLKPYLIEEAYEVLDAIEQTPESLRDELGDVLLQVMLHAQIAHEANNFEIADVIERIDAKMVRRHPHVFGDVEAKDSTQVLQNWERLKQKERETGASLLDGVPRGMPALLRAQRIGDKASRAGVDWHNADAVLDKLEEEWRELLHALRHESETRQADELGDLLFTVAQFARKRGLNSEEVLHAATEKFSQRFRAMERESAAPLETLSPEQLDELWRGAKRQEDGSDSSTE